MLSIYLVKRLDCNRVVESIPVAIVVGSLCV